MVRQNQGNYTAPPTELIHLIAGSLYPLTTFTHSPDAPQPPVYCGFYEFEFFFQIPYINEIIWYLSFSDSLQLAYILKVHPWISLFFFMTNLYSIQGHFFIYLCLLQFLYYCLIFSVYKCFNSLVKLIPKYFIVLDVITNKIFFLNFQRVHF